MNDEVNFENLSLARKELQNMIFNKQTTSVTEHISQYLKIKHHFKSIRNDNDMEIWIYQDGIYKPNGKSYIVEYTRELLGFMFTTYLGNQIVAKIYADTFINQEDFFDQQNQRPELLPVKNGILNIYTKTLYPFSPNKYFFSKINAEYKEEATCPKIKEFIESIVDDDKDYLTIQEMMGFCLLRDYSFEKGFMLYGEHGRNGKSKLLTLIKEFVSVENCASVSLSEIEKEQFALINLHNKLVNISADLSDTAINNTGNYKSLTGRDTINANRKGQSHIKFVNYAKMIFATNDLPMIKNFSSAFSLRWVMIDFPYRFLPQHEIDSMEDKSNCFLQDPNILNNLHSEEEFNGLLNWALDGLERIRATNKFSNETNSNAVRKYWLRKSNSVSAFIEDLIDIDYNSQISKRDFRTIYNEYCKNNNIKQLSDQAIAYTMSNELGIFESNIRKGEERERVWLGIKFKTLRIDNTDLIMEHIKAKEEVKFREFLDLVPNKSNLTACLKVLQQEGSIVELPAGTWRLVK